MGMHSDHPESIELPDGRTATRDIGADHQSGVRRSCGGSWPMKPCVGSGVHPDQAQELRDHFKRSGVNCEVNSSGDPIYTDRHQRRRALKCRAMHDRSSYD